MRELCELVMGINDDTSTMSDSDGRMTFGGVCLMAALWPRRMADGIDEHCHMTARYEIQLIAI